MYVLQSTGLFCEMAPAIIVIPDDLVPALKDAIETVITSEAIVLEPARAAGFDIDRLEEVWAEFEAART